jgi:hypothetical protein
MQQCAHCRYLVPTGYLSCPQCSMPLTAGAVTPNTVYTGKSASRKDPKVLVIGIGVALLAVVAITLVAKGGGGGNEPIENNSLPTIASDGWRNFTPPDGAFTVAFPSTPTSDDAAIGSLNERGQKYFVKQGDFEFGVVVSNAPTYVAPHEAGRRIEQWMRDGYQGLGATIEAAGQVLTPRGDQAFDIVFVIGSTRTWNRVTTWGGNLVRVYAELPADKQPTAAQSAIHSRMRDSLRQ